MLLLATKTVSYFRIKTFRNATTFLCLLLIKCENIFYVCQYNFSRIRRRRLHYRELKHVGRQHDDDGQKKFLQINYSKENLSYVIIRMNLVYYKMLKTLALCLERVLPNRILSCTCYGLKCRRCIKDVKICDLPL